LISILVFSQCVQITVSDGIGVVPAFIEMDNRLKGATYNRQITIFNSGEEPILFDLQANGDIESWITFYKYENLSVSITNITVDYEQKIIMEFNIPEDIANGEYEGTVDVTSNRGEKAERGATVNVVFPVRISFNVIGTQILTGNVSEIKIEDVEVGYPLIISLYFLNTGNVIATPVINVDTTRESFPIESFIYSDTDVDVDDGERIFVEWDTTNREPGKYNAHVNISLGDNVLVEVDLPFELFPRGTFTRKGELTNLSYSGSLSKDKTVKIIADFKNTGTIETKGRFIGEVYKDNDLVEIIEGKEEVTIKSRETYTFIEYFTIKEIGKYKVRGYVQYENNKTIAKEISFEVKGFEIAVFSLENVILIGLAIVVVGAGARILYLLVKKSKKKEKKRKKPIMALNSYRKSDLNKPIHSFWFKNISEEKLHETIDKKIEVKQKINKKELKAKKKKKKDLKKIEAKKKQKKIYGSSLNEDTKDKHDDILSEIKRELGIN
jgi:hypothetical protein